jgi:hypothetical protein
MSHGFKRHICFQEHPQCITDISEDIGGPIIHWNMGKTNPNWRNIKPFMSGVEETKSTFLRLQGLIQYSSCGARPTEHHQLNLEGNQTSPMPKPTQSAYTLASWTKSYPPNPLGF